MIKMKSQYASSGGGGSAYGFIIVNLAKTSDPRTKIGTQHRYQTLGRINKARGLRLSQRAGPPLSYIEPIDG